MGPTRPGRRLSHAARGDECDVMTKKYGRGISGRMRQPASCGFHKTKHKRFNAALATLNHLQVEAHSSVFKPRGQVSLVSANTLAAIGLPEAAQHRLLQPPLSQHADARQEIIAISARVTLGARAQRGTTLRRVTESEWGMLHQVQPPRASAVIK